MRYFFLATILLAVLVFIIAGPRGHHFEDTPIEIFNDMDHQLKFKAQKPSDFFADGRIQRPPVDGTVPMGFEIPHERTKFDPDQIAEDIWNPFGEYRRGDNYYNTGKMGENWGDGIPITVTQDVLERGRQRYNIYCAICHSEAGDGNGSVAQYWGGAPIANLHQDRLLEMPDGQIYDVIVNGKGYNPTTGSWTMFPYAGKLTLEDRWAVVAYLRALQRSQNSTMDEVPNEYQKELIGEGDQ